MAAMRASNVRAAALRNRCFNLAKTGTVSVRVTGFAGTPGAPQCRDECVGVGPQVWRHGAGCHRPQVFER